MTAAAKSRKIEKAPFKTSFLEEARKLGLAGCLNGPPDLGANRARYVKQALRARHARSR